MKRRKFISTSAAYGTGIILGSSLFANSSVHDIVKLTIIHTNDVHSRVEPFPDDGSRNANRGGAARRSTLINNIRQTEKNVLLFDSGDLIQGTPYFNFFGGEVEIKLMNQMRYDACTIGNHDFDNGLDGLVRMIDRANFPFLISNYEWNDDIIQSKTKTHQIFDIEGIKIGVFGLGVEMEGLVPDKLYQNTVYTNPIEQANLTATQLRDEYMCNYVVCLSHLGYKYKNDKVSDLVLAAESKNIDLILGGHTHTFMKKPEVLINKENQAVIVNQVGFAGLLLGRLDIIFEKNKHKCVSCENIQL